MEATANGSGYRFVAADGGIFAYGSSQFYGTPAFAPPPVPPAPTPTPTPVGGGCGASCSISLTNSSPTDGSTETATISSNQPNASVILTKHYKTTTSTDSGATDAGGNASIDFNIAQASAGYTVVVDASVGCGELQYQLHTGLSPATALWRND